MKRMILKALLLLSSSAVAGPYISSPFLSGDCAGDDIRVVEEGGKYYIAAFFSGMAAVTGDQSYVKKRCTMDYRVSMPSGYKLEVFQFSVDGIYQLSDQGTARLTVSHRASNGKSARTTAFYSLRNGDQEQGDIWDYTGDIKGHELAAEDRECGASIPLTTSVYASAQQPRNDLSGTTMVDLDEGASSGYTKLCQIRFKRCW